MAEYEIRISGVHYGANGDSVAGQKDTEEMHMRTRELLSWIDRTRPIITLSPDPKNRVHENALQARALGNRIGRVVAFGETHCDKTQRQTIELLVHWLRDDYELAHCEEIEALAEDTQLKLANAMEKMANKKTNAFTVYPQPGSTANLGCDQKNSDFKTYLPKADGSEEQSMLESNKKADEDVKIIK